MALFDRLGTQQNNNIPSLNQVNNMASQLRNDPFGFLQKIGFNVPNGIDPRNPNAIINYLIQSRQVNGGLLGIAQQMMGMFK